MTETLTGAPVTLTVTVTAEITPQFLFDVFITACEGGVNYWTDIANYHWRNDRDGSDDLEGFSALLLDWNSGEKHSVDFGVIATGLERIAAGGIAYLNEPSRQAIVNAILTDDAGEIDATLADLVVQAGLFDQIVYG